MKTQVSRSQRGKILIFILLGSSQYCDAFITRQLTSPLFPKKSFKISSTRHLTTKSARKRFLLLAQFPNDISFGGSEEDRNGPKIDWLKPTLAIAIPAWVGMMADPILSLIDTAFVGRLGSNELAALGACTSIFHLAFQSFRATTMATTTLVASSETEEEKKRVINLSLMFGFGVGWTMLLFLMKLGPWCLARMGVASSSSLYEPAVSYLSARAWAAPAVLGLVVSEGAFRGYGDTLVPLISSTTAAVMNLVLDPILIFPPIGLGVAGAAAATVLSQVGAFAIYGYYLMKKKMLFSVPLKSKSRSKGRGKSRNVILSILGANFAMMAKQSSLLLGWAYATAKATRLGKEHVAAHQVALSFWLVFALWLDGAAVAAQVLTSQSRRVRSNLRSLSKYMAKLAIWQGLATSFLIYILGRWVPMIFTTSIGVRQHLVSLMPHLALQQVLTSLTLVAEAIAVGGKQFSFLAFGTTLSTLLSVQQIQRASSVEQIWSRGIAVLFIGRLATALIAISRLLFYSTDGGIFTAATETKREDIK
mmetsp:Transcript_30541/g.46263  ORF Transcript_30541/g.46263 Transcript_30541/m.46263 type:complete len:534 (-) Transcript_30541:822-2423(-)